MKTKGKYKKSLSRTVPDQTPAARPQATGQKAAVSSWTSGLLRLSPTKSREQSENVYENKGQVQNIAESKSVELGRGISLLLLNVVPEAQNPCLIDGRRRGCRSRDRRGGFAAGESHDYDHDAHDACNYPCLQVLRHEPLGL